MNNTFFDFDKWTSEEKMDGKSGEYSEIILATIYRQAEEIARRVVIKGERKRNIDMVIDDIVTSRYLGIPIMILLLAFIFFITIKGANYPSSLLASFFAFLEDKIAWLLIQAGCPDSVYGFLVLGVYRCTAWVVAVMLPPMAIFFPLFTLLEDAGYLPRVAFNLDNIFHRVGTCGKQALTMCMGFGCNAAGVTSCRIIDSPRERMIAIITNSFVPCNGRFPLLIALSLIFIGGATAYKGILAALFVAGLVLTGIMITFLVSFLLSRTLLRGIPSSFALELPPYRKPFWGQVIVRSIFDRTVFILMRAVTVSAPAGAIIWLLANIKAGDTSMFGYITGFLDPIAKVIGLDGVILTAFILGLPANELVLPLILMGYTSGVSMVEVGGLDALKEMLVVQHGWTVWTAVCVMLFSLLHYPCATTLLTVKKEAGSWKWVLLAFIIPLLVATGVCFIVAQSARLVGF